MKKSLLCTIVLLACLSFISAQPPQKMTYQTVVRDANNELVVNQPVGVRVSVLKDSANGIAVYIESHTVTTNANALATITVGTGTPLIFTSFKDLDWAHNNYFLKTEIDPAGGTNYTITGVQEFLSVPYAFYSENAKYVDTALFAYKSDTSLYSYSANNANSATYATSAGSAATATSALYADSASVADFAHNANNANSATYATSAGSAATATTATSALYADSASVADFAHNANTANSATYATSAGSAATATTATSALYADSASIADFAHDANTANSATYATSAGSAATATSATYADTTRIANASITSNTANYADSSDFNHLANKPMGVNKGDILYWETNDNAWHIVPAGNNGEVLTMGSNNVPQWSTINIGGSTPTNELTITTIAVTDITGTAATSGGNVISDGGSSVTERGICWNNIGNPTIADNHIIEGGIGIGSFTIKITGLIPETKYYMRAYAINSSDTAYGEIYSFTTLFICGYNKIKDYDNNEYATVPIGTQCWMKENLRVTKYSDGTALTIGGSATATNVAYAYHVNGDASNDQSYGLLYNWTAATRGIPSSADPSGCQGICPLGWHVPSTSEWIKLTNYLQTQSAYSCGGTATAIARALASTSGWTSGSSSCTIGNSQANNNKTGFGAMPAGRYNTAQADMGNYAYYWTSFELNNNAIYFTLCYSWYYVSNSNATKAYGHSVRCIKD